MFYAVLTSHASTKTLLKQGTRASTIWRATRVKYPDSEDPQGFPDNFIISKIRHVGHDLKCQ